MLVSGLELRQDFLQNPAYVDQLSGVVEECRVRGPQLSTLNYPKDAGSVCVVVEHVWTNRLPSSPFALPGAVLLRPSLNESAHLLPVSPRCVGYSTCIHPPRIPRRSDDARGRAARSTRGLASALPDCSAS